VYSAFIKRSLVSSLPVLAPRSPVKGKWLDEKGGKEEEEEEGEEGECCE